MIYYIELYLMRKHNDNPMVANLRHVAFSLFRFKI